MRGRLLRRQIASYGAAFARNFANLEAAPAIPRCFRELRSRAAAWAGIPPGQLTQALVQRYPPRAGIGWHCDAQAFGAPIIGISFGGVATLRLRRDRTRRPWSVRLERGSIYAFEADSRWAYEHAVVGVTELRYSITFRTMNLMCHGRRPWKN